MNLRMRWMPAVASASIVGTAVVAVVLVGAPTASAADALGINITPRVTSASPVVPGTLLRANGGDWGGKPTLTFQWQRCPDTPTSTCVNIPGSTGTNYRVVEADRGNYLSLVVTATNATGSMQSRTDLIRVGGPNEGLVPTPGKSGPPIPSIASTGIGEMALVAPASHRQGATATYGARFTPQNVKGTVTFTFNPWRSQGLTTRPIPVVNGIAQTKVRVPKSWKTGPMEVVLSFVPAPGSAGVSASIAIGHTLVR